MDSPATEPAPAAPPAAPVPPPQTPPAQSTAVPASAPVTTLPVADTQPSPPAQPDAGRASLPETLDDIENFFQGTAPLKIANTAVEGAPAEPAAPVAPVAPDPAAPAPPAATPPTAPVTAPPASAPALPADVQRALDLQRSLNGDRQPGQPGYVPLTDAIAQIAAADKPAAAAAPGPNPVEVANTAVTTAETELAALQQQRRELAEDGSFYGPKHAELDDAILAKNRELSKAENEHEKAKTALENATAATENAAYQREVAARQGAMAKAAAEFPSAASKDTPLGKRITATVAAMQDPNHPDHAILHSANAAVHVTTQAAIAEAQDMAAKSNGALTFAQAFESLRAAPAGTPAATPPNVESEPRRVSPVPGSQGTLPPATKPTEAQVLKASETDLDLIEQMLYPNGATFAVGR